MSRTLAAILGGAAGAVALLVIVVILLWFCLFHDRCISRNSETGSSDPSIQVGTATGIEFSSRELRCFDFDELSSATKNFGNQTLIAQGKFGEVYKGLLTNGMLVAIKRRPGARSQEFVEEACYLSSIRHRNVVSLLGYCQENHQQMLVYEYIPNGSVSLHLYGSGRGTQEKLEFKHRLSIALGAAKGLAHLHSLSPRLIHKDFKTNNVLVDENFIAKVADAGIRHFLGRFDVAGPSSQVEADELFLAPEVKEFRQFSERSDVYSFGVFLLELVSGQEARELCSPDSDKTLVESVQNYLDVSSISKIADERLGNRFTMEGMEEFVQLIIRCIHPSRENRPSIAHVVEEIDRILEKEMNLTTGLGEGTPTITLGSQLFRALK